MLPSLCPLNSSGLAYRVDGFVIRQQVELEWLPDKCARAVEIGALPFVDIEDALSTKPSAKRSKLTRELADRINAAVDEVRRRVPGVPVGAFTGAPFGNVIGAQDTFDQLIAANRQIAATAGLFTSADEMCYHAYEPAEIDPVEPTRKRQQLAAVYGERRVMFLDGGASDDVLRAQLAIADSDVCVWTAGLATQADADAFGERITRLAAEAKQ